MALISLKWFGGMIPRRGEQHLPPYSATEAQNTDLYSGELRPLIKASLSHQFERPTSDDFVEEPGTPEPPPPPAGCIAIAITSQPTPPLTLEVGDLITLSFTTNADATPPVQYQWYKNGVAVPGAVSTTYTATAEVEDSYARFQATAINPCGDDATDEILLPNVDLPLVVSP